MPKRARRILRTICAVWADVLEKKTLDVVVDGFCGLRFVGREDLEILEWANQEDSEVRRRRFEL